MLITFNESGYLLQITEVLTQFINANGLIKTQDECVCKIFKASSDGKEGTELHVSIKLEARGKVLVPLPQKYLLDQTGKRIGWYDRIPTKLVTEVPITEFISTKQAFRFCSSAFRRTLEAAWTKAVKMRMDIDSPDFSMKPATEECSHSG